MTLVAAEPSGETKDRVRAALAGGVMINVCIADATDPKGVRWAFGRVTAIQAGGFDLTLANDVTYIPWTDVEEVRPV